MRIRDCPSPNFDSRSGDTPALIVLHYTGMRSFAEAFARMRDPRSAVSCHYLIDEDGEIVRLVEDSMRAWHAGVASWGGVGRVNARSVGIELAHPGHVVPVPSYPEPQLLALERLLARLRDAFGIPPQGVLGHSDVSHARKRDPGEWFPWPRLAEKGLAVWIPGPEGRGRPLGPTGCGELQETLATIGYQVQPTGRMDAVTRSAFRAFQRRFRGLEVGRPACADALVHAREIAGRWPSTTGENSS